MSKFLKYYHHIDDQEQYNDPHTLIEKIRNKKQNFKNDKNEYGRKRQKIYPYRYK